MKELLMATTNPAKIAQLAGILSPIGVTVVGVPDKTTLPIVAEDGLTPLENAHKKALAYAAALNKTVISTDTALYIDVLEGDPRQPGLNVRRIPGSTSRPTDLELLAYYEKLISQFGSQVTAKWESAFCVATPTGITHEIVLISPTILANKPSTHVLEGYPLESLQIDPQSGKFRSDMTQTELTALWNNQIGAPLLDFIQNI